MHVWFRFCAVIALMASLQSAMAQSTPATASGNEIPVSKHRLKPSAIDIVQHQSEQQSKRIEQLSAQIEAQTKQIEQQTRQIEAQTKLTEELTKRAELQTKQIETLNGDVNRLTTVLLTRGAEKPAPSSVTPHETTATPVVQTGSSVATEPPVVIKAEPVVSQPETIVTPDGPTHLVKRGENLISIARMHGTTVSELLKLNKIEDERKLQIGQTLLLPKPTSPKPDSQ